MEGARLGIQILSFVAPAVLALVIAITAQGNWQEYLLFKHSEPFGQVDPLFHNDISFYVFKIPFLQVLQGMATTAALLALGLTAAAYSVSAVDEKTTRRRNTHIATLAAAFALTLSWGVWLGRYDLLYSDHGGFYGAGYTDLHANLPVASLQTVLLIAIAGLCLIAAKRPKPWLLPVMGLAAYVLVTVVGGAVYPSLLQRFRVVPNQLGAERDYIARDLEMTRQAFGLANVQVKTYMAGHDVDAKLLGENQSTIDNIRLWDWPQLGAVYTAKEALRKYYTFVLSDEVRRSGSEYNIDVDRYTIDGATRQVMLAARELNLDGLAEDAHTWQNTRMQYTHGYGIVMSPVNKVDADGLPEYFLHEIPVKSLKPELKLDVPQIYFGEMTNDYAFVKTKLEELDYPDEAGNKTTHYSGTGGVPLGGSLSRMMWSMRLHDTNMLFSGELTNESRILFRRDIRSRLRGLAPFLTWDEDPYLVLHGGRLAWIADGYTMTDRYPYSRPVAIQGNSRFPESVNYIRNSVKAVIDAYDGTTALYVFDEADPIIRTYQKVFPKLFQASSSMPAELRKHVRYPEGLFKIQRNVYARYHMTDPRDYYQREDLWSIPSDPTPDDSEISTGSVGQMKPYYVQMKLPAETNQEFILMSPFTPMATQNLSAWICARCDEPGYGQLIAYRFPKGITVNGPQQIIGQIKQNRDVSQFQTLVGQRGSRVIFGNLLAIPLGESLLYAVPVYVQASDAGAATIPEISQVILATGNRIVMRSRLPEAVAALAAAEGVTLPPTVTGGQPTNPQGTPPDQPKVENPPVAGTPLDRASQAYKKARQRQKEYEKALDELGAALEDLKKTGAPKGGVGQ
jgi:uncharacterized membrane protein (UPF0182 family)